MEKELTLEEVIKKCKDNNITFVVSNSTFGNYGLMMSGTKITTLYTITNDMFEEPCLLYLLNKAIDKSIKDNKEDF